MIALEVDEVRGPVGEGAPASTTDPPIRLIAEAPRMCLPCRDVKISNRVGKWFDEGLEEVDDAGRQGAAIIIAQTVKKGGQLNDAELAWATRLAKAGRHVVYRGDKTSGPDFIVDNIYTDLKRR